MTADEAMQVVKKAAGMAQWMDGAKHACGNPLSVAEWETLQIALRAIAPDGPLCVVPKGRAHHLNAIVHKLLWATTSIRGAGCMPDQEFDNEVKSIETAARAMIAEKVKP